MKFSTTHAQIYVSFHNTLLRKIKKILNRPFTNDVNKTKQELPKRNKYFTDSNEKVYEVKDIRANLNRDDSDLFFYGLSNKNMLTVESPCGIEPQSLANENLSIRP